MPAARSIPRPAPWSRRFISPPPFSAPKDGDFPTGFDYSRTDNPNRAALEKALAIIEGGAVAAAFASGLAAAMAVFQALAPNDHVVAPREAYYGVLRLLRDVLRALATARSISSI